MTNKRFRDWIEQDQDEWVSEEKFDKRKDEKRYDKKKAKIQNARRNKNKNKFSHFD